VGKKGGNVSDIEVHGPIDFVLIEFEADKLTGAVADALLDLVDRGLVRIYDLLVVEKDADGTFSVIDISELGPGELGGLTVFAGANSGLLGDEDLEEAANALEPGTVAVLIVYENAWARPVVAAVRDSGGEVVASERIPASAILEALDAVEAAN
jgi:uncharacterized membrane protein